MATRALRRLLERGCSQETEALVWSNFGLLHSLQGRASCALDAYSRAAALRPAWYTPAFSGLFQAVRVGNQHAIRSLALRVETLVDPEDPALLEFLGPEAPSGPLLSGVSKRLQQELGLSAARIYGLVHGKRMDHAGARGVVNPAH